MKELVANRYIGPQLFDLLIGIVLGSGIENFLRTEADSEQQHPERILVATLVATGSYILVFLVVYSRKRWFEFLPNWVLLGILGSFISAFINHGVLRAYWLAGDGGRTFLSLLPENANIVIGSAIAYSLLILAVLLCFKLIIFAVSRMAMAGNRLSDRG